MSRLQRHQDKEFTKRIGLFIGLFIIIVVFLGTVGIKALLGFSVFIANLGNDQTVNQEDDNFIGNIDVSTIPVATNSAHIIVGGNSLNYDILEFYVNDEKVHTLPDVSDAYEEEIGDLNTGKNEVYILAKTRNKKHSEKSQVFTVTYVADKPKLEIKEPSDGAKTNKSEIKVVGTTSKEVYIKVNDSPVVSDAQSNFEALVRLNEGENKIVITAQDTAGNIESKTITVRYEKDD